MSHWVFVSHPWGASCPAYANGRKVEIQQDKCLNHGDSCNSVYFSSPNHIGSHMDAPLHFNPEGASITDFSAASFIHNEVACLWFEKTPGSLITADEVAGCLAEISPATTLLFFRSGACRWRGQDDFWKRGTGIGPGVASLLRHHCPQLAMIGVDSISISSLEHRDIGRTVHREFLNDPERPISILEDLNLEALAGKRVSIVIVAPLRIEGGDGAPCTVFAQLRSN